MAQKILDLVDSCGSCRNCVGSRCNLVDEIVLDKHVVAPFCPLPDYPSRMIAGQQVTIESLRRPNEYGLTLGLLTHVAAKLKLNLEPSARGVTIPFKDGAKDREVYLGMDYVTEVDLHRSEVIFMAGGNEVYRLSPDTSPPILWEKIPRAARILPALAQHPTTLHLTGFSSIQSTARSKRSFDSSDGGLPIQSRMSFLPCCSSKT